ncbi:MAG: DUF6359 domain-containing protein [Prevotellaceae bacterium]|jgi:hypothetical protein|nr:DUF6359 domain-containing protein [Prevotellaceae bacterium]
MKSLKLFSIIAVTAMFAACKGGDPTIIKFTSADQVAVSVGGTLNFDVTVKVTNGKGDTQIVFEGLPEWVSKTEGTDKVTLTGTAPSEAHDYPVTIKATNNKETKTQNFTIKVGGTVVVEGDGSQANPYSCAQGIAFTDASSQQNDVWVGGYIVGGVATTISDGASGTNNVIAKAEDVVFGATGVRATAVVIADNPNETDYKKCFVVKLTGEQDNEGNVTHTCPEGFQGIINLNAKPCNIGEYLKIQGDIYRYFAVPAIRRVMDFEYTEKTCPVAEGVIVTTGVFTNAIPSGWTYISNDPVQYPDPTYYNSGSLKLNFEGMGLLSPVFAVHSSVKVVIDIDALNGNTKTATSADVFTITGLNSEGTVIATQTIQNPVAVGESNVTLTASGIVQVKVIMTGYPNNGTTRYNVSLKSISVKEV